MTAGKKLTDDELRLTLALVRYYRSLPQIAKQLHMARSSVYARFAKLIDLGYVVMEPGISASAIVTASGKAYLRGYIPIKENGRWSIIKGEVQQM